MTGKQVGGARASAAEPRAARGQGTPWDVLSYPHQDVPAPGTVREVAHGVFWVRMPLPFALDHINLWLLEDGDGWAIVDCGYAASATRDCWERVFADCLGGRPVRRIIATHYHPDHLGLACWLMQRFDAPLWMSQADFLTAQAVFHELPGYDVPGLIAHFRRHGLDEERLGTLERRGNGYRRGVQALPGSYRRLMEGDTLEINGVAWQVAMGYGHAPEHAALHSEELGVLISGDMVLPRISTNVSVWAVEPDGNPLRLFLESIERYARLPAHTLVLPSHGKPFHGLHPRVRDLELHHEQRLAELVAACGEPAAAAGLLGTLFRRELDTHQVFFAMGETIAHLNFLLFRGALQRFVDEGGVCRFVRDRSHLAGEYSDVL